MNKTEQIKSYSKQLRLPAITNSIDEMLMEAQKHKPGFTDYTLELLEKEIDHRSANDLNRRMKLAGLPINHDLQCYDYGFDNGLEKQQLNQLKECIWLEQNYNLVFMGPSGTGKTYLSAGLCHQAVQMGYKAYFTTMHQIMQTLKLKAITRSAKTQFNRWLKAHLLVIDDIMLFPVEQPIAVEFFHLINHLFEQASFIITTNKEPRQWAKQLNDEVLATALLDRLLYRCQVIHLKGKSYRLINRKTIF